MEIVGSQLSSVFVAFCATYLGALAVKVIVVDLLGELRERRKDSQS